jgi:hypothetical protein
VARGQVTSAVEHTQQRDGGGENGRLRVGGQLQVGLWALEAQARQCVSQCPIGARECVSAGVHFGDSAPHAYVL